MAPAGPAAAGLAVAALLAAAIGVAVFRGALGIGFSQDDWFGVARASGLLPRLVQPWRWLAAQGTYDALLPLFGMRGGPWHLLPLAAHALVAAGLALLFARRWGAPAALVGAAFFAAHPASFHALWWFSAHSDVMATFFSLGALVLALRPGRARWGALPLFALALLEKESVVLLPIVVWAVARAQDHRDVGPRDPAWLALAGLAVAEIAYFALVVIPARFVETAAAAHAMPAREAYATDPAQLLPTLLTYMSWAANAWLPTMHAFTDAIDPGAFAWGGAMLVLLAAAAFVPALRARGGAAIAIVVFALLAPVLPLTRHTYHYYLYGALAGVAALVALFADALLERRPAKVAWPVALVLAALFAANGVAVVDKIASMPFLLPELRADGVVDRARIAEAAIADVRDAHLPPHAPLAMWSPQSMAIAAQRGDDPAKESYFERNVRAALLDGLVLRLTVPGLDSVRFERTFAPADSSEPWAVYRPDGHLRVLPAAELARLVASAPR